MKRAVSECFSQSERSELIASVGPIVDAHHHFWDLAVNSYPWLQESPVPSHIGDYSAICKSYLPEDYLADLAGIELRGSVHVEAHWRGGRFPVEETTWLVQQFEDHHLPTGIVGHADLTAADAGRVLDAHMQAEQFRGVRVMALRGGINAGRALLCGEPFRRGVAMLAERHLRLELQINASLAREACRLANELPQMAIVIIHGALPLERSSKDIIAWRNGVKALANCPNMHIKLSGLPMADWHWTPATLAPFAQFLVDAFGPERVMFGSNFPVDGLYSDYPTMLAGYIVALNRLSSEAQHQVFGESANRFYALELDMSALPGHERHG